MIENIKNNMLRIGILRYMFLILIGVPLAAICLISPRFNNSKLIASFLDAVENGMNPHWTIYGLRIL